MDKLNKALVENDEVELLCIMDSLRVNKKININLNN